MAGAKLESIEYDPGALRPEQVQVKVESCGICHSDLSMIDNAWGNSRYPLVPGHEVIGVIEAAGDQAKGLKPGDRVGLGWFSEAAWPASRASPAATSFAATPSRSSSAAMADSPTACAPTGNGR